MAVKRICVIGAGPAGMSMLHHLAEIEEMPDVVCFEKQSTWGGQWNVSWKTGKMFLCHQYVFLYDQIYEILGKKITYSFFIEKNTTKNLCKIKACFFHESSNSEEKNDC